MRARPALLCLALAACRPALPDTPELIVEPRILAVQADPAEVAPGAAVTLRAFVATPDGPGAQPVAWAFCRTPKPLGENNVVAAACLDEDLPAAGPAGLVLATRVPADACSRFGPDTPPQTGTAPPSRPRDPDGTGGFYQPVRVSLDAQVAIAQVRIRCALALAPLDVVRAYQERYHANVNPQIATLDAGATIVATWPAASAEAFPIFDPATQALVDHTETVQASFYATVQPGASSSGAGHAQVQVTGPAHVWLVLRDDRGGVDVRHLELSQGVTP